MHHGRSWVAAHGPDAKGQPEKWCADGTGSAVDEDGEVNTSRMLEGKEPSSALFSSPDLFLRSVKHGTPERTDDRPVVDNSLKMWSDVYARGKGRQVPLMTMWRRCSLPHGATGSAWTTNGLGEKEPQKQLVGLCVFSNRHSQTGIFPPLTSLAGLDTIDRPSSIISAPSRATRLFCPKLSASLPCHCAAVCAVWRWMMIRRIPTAHPRYILSTLPANL